MWNKNIYQSSSRSCCVSIRVLLDFIFENTKYKSIIYNDNNKYLNTKCLLYNISEFSFIWLELTFLKLLKYEYDFLNINLYKLRLISNKSIAIKNIYIITLSNYKTE